MAREEISCSSLWFVMNLKRMAIKISWHEKISLLFTGMTVLSAKQNKKNDDIIASSSY